MRTLVVLWLVALFTIGPVGSASADHPFGCPAACPTGAALRTTEVHTSTLDVRDVVLAKGSLFVATGGGVERYDGPDFSKRRVYTTIDGLDTPDVRGVRLDGAAVRARTPRSECMLRGDRFACVARASLATAPAAVGPDLAGSRVTIRVQTPAGEVIGTAGAGLWLKTETSQQRLTPDGQVCGGFVRALEAHQGALWIGTFHEGLCVREGGSPAAFRRVAAPFRMVNDLASTPTGLFVAANEGLFLTRDGSTFSRIDGIEQRGVNDLAFDGDALWATTPGALWRVRAGEGRTDGVWWRPAGSRSLQAVDVEGRVGRGGALWLATEDRGAVRFDGRTFRSFDRATGLPTSWGIDVAAQRDGSVYLATLRNGVVRIEANGVWSQMEGVPDAWALRVHGDTGRMLVGTQGGAAVTSIGHPSRELTGLPDARVHAFAELGTTLWVGTELGLAEVR